MNENLKLAIELSRRFIQNNNVKPMHGRDGIIFVISSSDGVNISLTFKDIVSNFLDELELIDRWEI
ncbi:hypothetical protein BTR23_07495 [Alkalihalophilus pseudofirmus]|nr:hypothetical protein BTR23_07495 [Alkalihalophilus pseudofirmus]